MSISLLCTFIMGIILDLNKKCIFLFSYRKITATTFCHSNYMYTSIYLCTKRHTLVEQSIPPPLAAAEQQQQQQIVDIELRICGLNAFYLFILFFFIFHIKMHFLFAIINFAFSLHILSVHIFFFNVCKLLRSK